MLNKMKTALVASVLLSVGTPAFADMSPDLLIVSKPSDNPLYRRMVEVKYLTGTRVSANYKAYNRREFINTPNTTSGDVISACTRGKKTSLGELKAFKKSEARREQSGQTPEIRTFCIKGISNWTDQNKDKYLDPIFDGMPYLAK